MATNSIKTAADLYAQMGVIGDQEGLNYWQGRMDKGEDVTGAFKDSAKSVIENYAANPTDAKGDRWQNVNLNSKHFVAPTTEAIHAAGQAGDVTKADWTLNKATHDFLYGKPAQTQEPQPTAPSNGFNLNGMREAEQWAVDPKTQTVAGQLQSILASDSPLMAQARARAAQVANASGLANSSMAMSAADSAMYDKALDIATPDAATYADAGKSNVAAKNQFGMQNNQLVGDIKKMDVQQGYDMAKLEKQGQISKDNALAVADIESKYKQLTQASSSATSLLNTAQQSYDRILANTALSTEARDAAIADVRANTINSLKMVGAISGDMDLSSFVDQIFAED